MSKFMTLWYAVGVWLAAGAFWANVITLLPQNADYNASWWKVAAFAAMFVWFMHGFRRASHDRLA